MGIHFDFIQLSQAQKNPVDPIDYAGIAIQLHAPASLDRENSLPVWIFLKTLIEGGAVNIIVDMQLLEYIDSAGIAVLVNVTRLLREKKGEIALVRIPPKVENILEPVNLGRLLKIFHTEAEAANYFENKNEHQK